jgi:hypothetical protein
MSSKWLLVGSCALIFGCHLLEPYSVPGADHPVELHDAGHGESPKMDRTIVDLALQDHPELAFDLFPLDRPHITPIDAITERPLVSLDGPALDGFSHDLRRDDTKPLPDTKSDTIPSPDTIAVFCNTSKDCPSNMYCYLKNCSPSSGVCAPKSLICPSVAVCGCDDHVYASACSAAQAGVSTGSTTQMCCDELATRWIKEVDQAKACDSTSNSPCSVSVYTTLNCPCNTTWVNQVTNAMNAMEQQWTALGCEPFYQPCPLSACFNPSSHSCTNSICVSSL